MWFYLLHRFNIHDVYLEKILYPVILQEVVDNCVHKPGPIIVVTLPAYITYTFYRPFPFTMLIKTTKHDRDKYRKFNVLAELN